MASGFKSIGAWGEGFGGLGRGRWGCGKVGRARQRAFVLRVSGFRVYIRVSIGLRVGGFSFPCGGPAKTQAGYPLTA